MSKSTPSGAALNQMFSEMACRMEKIEIRHQFNPLKIEYKLEHDRKRNEITIVIPTTTSGVLHIYPADKDVRKSRRFFQVHAPKQVRLPGGKVLKSPTKEIVHAMVDFVSHGEHESVSYIIDEPNFAEVIDTAIECLAQIDGIYLSPITKKRPTRGKKSKNNQSGNE